MEMVYWSFVFLIGFNKRGIKELRISIYNNLTFKFLKFNNICFKKGVGI